MISKNSFSKTMFMNMKGKIWGFAVACLSFFISFTVLGAVSATQYKTNVLLGLYSTESATKLFTRNILGENNILAMVFVCLMAAFIALNGFSYLFSKSKVDLYHSTPIRREELFAANYVAGLICYIIPYVVFLTLGILVGAVNGLVGFAGIKAALIMLIINLLGFIGTYNLTIIAIMLTGNVGVAILATGTLSFYGLFAATLVDTYKYNYFITYSDLSAGNILRNFSPVYLYFSLIRKFNSFGGEYGISVSCLLVYVAYCLLSVVACVALYRIRSSEAAGKSIAFKKTIPVISVFLLVFFALAGGIAFESIAGDALLETSYGWFAFGFIVTILLGHCIIQIIFHQDYKAVVKNPLSLGISAVVAAAISAVFLFDLTGYDTYIPADSEYVTAAVSSYGMQGYAEYYNFDSEVKVDEYGNHNVWVDSTKYRLDNMQLTDKELIKDFVAAALEDTKAERDQEIRRQNGEEIDYNNSPAYTYITVGYNKPNGKHIYRSYVMDLASHMDLYNRLYSTEYKEGVFSILSLADEDIDNIEYVDGLGNEYVKFTTEQMKELIAAYKLDLAAQDADSLKNEVPFYGFICRKVELKENGYTSHYQADKGYVYPSFERTLAVLNKCGIDLSLVFDVDNIENITVTNYNYDGEADYEITSKDIASDYVMEPADGSQKIYRDKEDIMQILQVASPYDAVCAEGNLHTTADLDISVTYKEVPAGYSRNYSFAIEKGQVPDFVAKDVNYKE